MSNPWTDADDAILRSLYNSLTNRELAEILGRTQFAVDNRRFKLGLKKDSNAGQFRAGFTPWNKGGSFEAGGRSVQTRFAPGSKPRNTLPIGTLRITKGDVLQMKVSDAPGNSSQRWRSVHEIVWIDANGPLPAGHIVRFRHGMKTTTPEEITPDRLECVTFAENMRANSIHSYGPEIARLYQLKGAITRQIKRRTA